VHGRWSGGSFRDWLGISLGDLAEGESFESLDGAFTFSGFEVDVSGSAPRRLDFYRVIPLDDGFKLVAPMAALCGSHGELHLSYDVAAGDALAIDAMSMSILGITIGSSAVVEATAQLSSGDELKVEAQGPFGQGDGDGYDDVLLAQPLETLSIDELVAVANGEHGGHKFFGGFAAGALVTHRFNGEPLVTPEPATALMLGSGFLGFVALARRRRLGQSPRR
jgi:hypothetical protein